MSTSEILDRFSLYRNNFPLFSGIAVLPAALALVMHFIGITTHITVPLRGRTPLETRLMFWGFELLVMFVSSAIGGGIATGATVYAVYGVQVQRPVTIGSSYRKVLADWLAVIWAAVLVFLLVLVLLALGTVGIVLVVIGPFTEFRQPAFILTAVIVLFVLVFTWWIYLIARYALVIPSLVLDKTSVRGAFRRCRFLSKGTVRRIFLVLVLVTVLGYALAWVLQIPLIMFWGVRTDPLFARMWTDVGQFFSRLLSGPISTIAVALIYIDQRIRKEAFDLQFMMDAIAETPTQTSQVVAQSAD